MATLNEVIVENGLKVGETSVPRAIEIQKLRDLSYISGMGHKEFAISSPEAIEDVIVNGPYNPVPPEPVVPHVDGVTVTPARGPVELGAEASLVFSVTIDGEGFQELEIDHSMQGMLPEFSVYANAADPYGGDRAQFEQLGVSVVYDPQAKKFEIDFGSTVTEEMVVNTPLSLYIVIKDAEGNALFGSMSPTTPENTFTYQLSRIVPDPIGEPEGEPTGEPTGEPEGEPTGEPTGDPV